ncbi:uncharacterized protein KY384_000528 [Bacidia gigantensis]|uniref:uncharacterized protein n=1 Tax=Bacidia gigantensis TaxID=2732470 RepID=UPI001D0455E0|nr:uncharacterized protein KY384_000528 [Bacidia gigantensis]KAG8525768.1 hypothetical protein KY384_000528 [Bacidia gigantensis]
MSYGPLFWLVKLSLFVLFIQIFRPFRWVRYCCWIGAVVTGLFYFAKLIVYASLCLPSVHGDHTALGYVKAWASPQCKNLTELMLATGAVNVVSDLYLMILPLPAVWQLNLPRKRKIGISFMFLTGAVNVEITAGIAVSCMPATAAVFNHFKPTIRSLLSSTASSLGLKRSSVRCTLTSLTPRRFHTGTNGAKAGCPKLPSVCQSARPFVVDGLASEEGRGDWRELAKIGEGKAMGQDRGLVVIEVEKVGERDADGGDSV